jgi:glycosyltransferase involved in cell wall biosynthesis
VGTSRADESRRGIGSTSPTLTVVVPTHDRERLLRAALASLRAQDLADCEFLILDNASQDSTPRLVRELQMEDSRFRLIRNDEDIGFQRNIHKGLLAARSDRILFLADDDIVLPKTLNLYSRVFDTYPGVSVVLSNLVALDPAGTTIKYVYRRFPRNELLDGQAALNRLWAEAAMISGLAIRRNELAEEWRADLVYPHLELLARLLRTEQAYGLEHYGIGARTHKGQLAVGILDAQEKLSSKHLFGELPEILTSVYGNRGPAFIEAACGHWLRHNYRIFLVNQRIASGFLGAWRSLKLALKTYPHFKRDPVALATFLGLVLIPAALARVLKEVVRRYHLASRGGSALHDRLSSSLTALGLNT